jgi:hypothetical protein
MNLDRQRRLVERLLDRTRAGELSWEETVEDNTFQVSFSKNSVQIRYVDLHRGSEYQISIIDDRGQITEVFSDVQLHLEDNNTPRPWRAIMHEIYSSARRRALKADEVIDSILSEIG